MKAAHIMAICRRQKQEGAFQSNGGAVAPLIFVCCPSAPPIVRFVPSPTLLELKTSYTSYATKMPGFCFSTKQKKKFSTFRLNVSSEQFIRTVVGHRSGNRAGAEE